MASFDSNMSIMLYLSIARVKSMFKVLQIQLVFLPLLSHCHEVSLTSEKV